MYLDKLRELQLQQAVARLQIARLKLSEAGDSKESFDDHMAKLKVMSILRETERISKGFEAYSF